VHRLPGTALLAWSLAACGLPPAESPGPPPAAAPPVESRAGPRGERVAGEYLVHVDGDAAAAVTAAFGAFGVVAVRRVSGRVHLVRLERDPGPEAVAAAAAGVPAIGAVQPNYRYRAFPGRPTPGR